MCTVDTGQPLNNVGGTGVALIQRIMQLSVCAVYGTRVLFMALLLVFRKYPAAVRGQLLSVTLVSGTVALVSGRPHRVIAHLLELPAAANRQFTPRRSHCSCFTAMQIPLLQPATSYMLISSAAVEGVSCATLYFSR